MGYVNLIPLLENLKYGVDQQAAVKLSTEGLYQQTMQKNLRAAQDLAEKACGQGGNRDTQDTHTSTERQTHGDTSLSFTLQSQLHSAHPKLTLFFPKET